MMKQVVYYMIVCCSVVWLFSACSKDSDFSQSGYKEGNDAIILDLSSSSLPLGRAIAQGPEVAIEHLDVLIFDEASESNVWHERITQLPASQGKISLSALRKNFSANQRYWVYLVANSTHTSEEFSTLGSLTALKSMTQSDRLVHLTGISNVSTAPHSFLMDGVAYLNSATSEPAAAPVVLNNGVSSDNTELKVVLRRAAAKIVVHINKGDDVEFLLESAGVRPGYYLRNLPFSTSLLAGIGAESELRTTQLSVTDYFTWNQSAITVTAYAYAHEWANASSLEKDTRLVVNIPLSYQGNDYPNSFYQIPVSRDKILKRNTYYEVSVTVNAPGAKDPFSPIVLTNLNYNVQPWEETVISVGGEGDRPIYLTVNETEVEMHNIITDSTTLRFSSSSSVSTTIKRVYYIDKFGQTQAITSPQEIQRMGISITPDQGLQGGIKINSPLPTNNTIRYIDLEVSNEDGATPCQVRIIQYPLEYITNILGWYSYRSDFGGTTWEAPGSRRYVSAFIRNSWGGNWEWYYGTSYPTWWSDPFFSSKVNFNTVESGSNAGKSDLYYYEWQNNASKSRSLYSSAQNGGNARMYHVRITASSGKYTIGRPKITNGVTDSGADNAQLVSPSFMIASQLGAVSAISDVEIAADHCSQYVEVYKNEDGEIVHLTDWRLPTEAELKIIMDFQYESDAMDEVLAGEWYWSASGAVQNPEGTDGSQNNAYIRCIRDAYETE